MQLVDTHCHLDEESFAGDVEAVIQAARDVGVLAMVSIGTDAASSRRTVELAQRFPDVYAAVGIHPNYIQAAKAGDWEQIEELALHPRVVAIGETGLDRFWKYSEPQDQREYFVRHLELSRRVGKPFIVHCREADDECREVLRNFAGGDQLRGVMHSFCQSDESAAECVRLGMHLSFTGMLTFRRNDELRQVCSRVPRDRLMVETDAPYLAPMPNRGKRNEPAFVRFTLKSMAEAHGLDVNEMGETTTANARRFFGIS